MNYKIAIMDDEKVFRDTLSEKLKIWGKETGNSLNISSFQRADDLLDEWETKNNFDVIFLDIKMNDNDFNGVETAQRIRQGNDDVIIVFVTSISDYLKEGYRLEAIRYLLKPIQDYDLQECMNKIALKLQSRKNEVFLLKYRDKLMRIPYKNIIYFSSANNYIHIHTTEETISYLKKLKHLEDTFPPQFVRCHRSLILNIENVSAIVKNDAVMINGDVLPISKQYRIELQKLFVQYFG